MVNYPQLLVLGAFAGLTIFLGLPIAFLQRVSLTVKGFLNAFAIGILIFLTIDVFSHAWQSTAGAVFNAFIGKSPVGNAVLDLLAMFGGLAIGLLGLTWYGCRYMKDTPQPSLTGTRVGGGGKQKHELQLLRQVSGYRLSMMIAIGIGAHNLSEGLAIGQSYASGAIGLAIILIIGFAAHNTTEGFGIAAPLTGLSKKPSNRFILLAGLVGGGPTFIGTLLGSLWTAPFAYIFFLSMAGGALVYVTILMYNSGRRQVSYDILMLGLFVGLTAGFLTDLIVTLGGA